MRQPIMTANWKMHTGRSAARDFASAFLSRIEGVDGVEIVIAPPFPLLDCLESALAGSSVALAAQNVHPEASGAFTGEVSTSMLRDFGCRYAIVGHSERRAQFGETDAFIAAKAAALLNGNLRPIVCIGESLAERESDRTFEVLGAQLAGSLASVPQERAAEIVVAYEPVWAIGTGRTATPAIAQEAHSFVRERLCQRFGGAGEAIRIQYGGSVKPDNVDALMSQPDIDGALVGGASLDPDSFSKIVRFEAQEPTS
jgi:triosephosphate isomerase